MARQFENWIEAFLDYTKEIKSPEIMRRWAGLSAIAAALQRRVWVRLGGQTLFPNLYILLVAPPGVGKSNAIKFSRGVVRKVPTLKLSPARITAAAFYGEMESAKGTMIDTEENKMYQYHALTAMVDEFSVFVRPGSNDFMADLADLFDCPDPFESKTKHQGQNIFSNAWFNLIGGCTPKYLKEAWSNTVLDEGFPSRVIIIHSEETISVELFSGDDDTAETEDNALKILLAKDLEIISSYHGRFTWDPKASAEFTSWYSGGMEPAPKDPRLVHYNQRRVVHVAKLAMLHSAAKRSDLEITLEDLSEARACLLFAESAMSVAVDALGASPVADQMKLVINFIREQAQNGKGGVPEYKIRRLLLNELDPMRVRALIGELLMSRVVMAVGETEGQRVFSYLGEKK